MSGLPRTVETATRVLAETGQHIELERWPELEELREGPGLERLEEPAPDERDRDQRAADPAQQAPAELARRFPEFPHRRHATPCLRC